MHSYGEKFQEADSCNDEWDMLQHLGVQLIPVASQLSMSSNAAERACSRAFMPACSDNEDSASLQCKYIEGKKETKQLICRRRRESVLQC